jgi:hypothetical protein
LIKVRKENAETLLNVVVITGRLESSVPLFKNEIRKQVYRDFLQNEASEKKGCTKHMTLSKFKSHWTNIWEEMLQEQVHNARTSFDKTLRAVV